MNSVPRRISRWALRGPDYFHPRWRRGARPLYHPRAGRSGRETFSQCLAERGGSIVNIGADYSRGLPGMGHNSSDRAGLSNLTFTAVTEIAGAGVRVNFVIPGFTTVTKILSRQVRTRYT